MPKIQFIATRTMKEYHDKPSWTDGEVRDVPVATAEVLCTDFPLNFVEPGSKRGHPGPSKNTGQPAPDTTKDENPPEPGQDTNGAPTKDDGQTHSGAPSQEGDAAVRDRIIGGFDNKQKNAFGKAVAKSSRGEKLSDFEADTLKLVWPEGLPDADKPSG